jgi:hypothetical protein
MLAVKNFVKCPSGKTLQITIFAIAAVEKPGVNAGDKSLQGRMFRTPYNFAIFAEI